MNETFNLNADIGYLSYLSCAFAYAILTGLLIVNASRQHGRDSHSRLLILASILTSVWAFLLGWRSVVYIGPEILWSIELIRSSSWIAFLYALLNQNKLVVEYKYFRILFLFVFIALLVQIWIVPRIWIHDSVARWLEAQFVGHMVLAIAGLVLVEQIYQNIRPEHRWWVKHLCLATGCMFAYDFYLYADALLLGHLSGSLWDARGATFILLSPFVVIAAVRNKDWSATVQFSRNLLFHSTALIATGIYLLVMGIVGHYIALFGKDWGQVAQIIFMVGAFLILVILLLSGAIRAQVRVFFSKHFFNYAYDYREEWLRITSLLSTDTSDQPLEHKAIAAVADSVNSSGGILWIRDHHGVYRWRVQSDADRSHLQRIDPENNLIRFIKKTRWVINFEEMERIPELYRGIKLEDTDWIRSLEGAWLLIPLFHRDDLYGLILLTRPQVDITWNWEVIDLLRTAGQQIAGMLALEDAARELTVAKQFEGFNRLSAFLVHDLKNMTAQLSLVVKNSERHHHNPDFMRDANLTVEHCVNKMNRLMMQLKQGETEVPMQAISLQKVMDEVKKQRCQQSPVPKFSVMKTDVYLIADHDRLVSVFEHVIQNAQEAAGKKGIVIVNIEIDDVQVVITIKDNGQGMSQAFIENGLFKPFETTKGLTGMGIGAYESREYMLAIGGDVEVESKVEFGTRFRLLIPIVRLVEKNTVFEKVNA
ncbi:MAG: XrtA/PEP-CTERM system histidine kinase PrsK [Methylococcales bacterium]